MVEFGFSQAMTNFKFVFQQMIDCVAYKAGHNLGLVVLIAVGLIFLWKMLGPDVRSA